MTTKAEKFEIEVGQNVFIRCLTYHYTGKVAAIDDKQICLTQAAWIADSGRFATAMANGQLSEVEPYPEDVRVFISRNNIVDICDWKHDLPRLQK